MAAPALLGTKVNTIDTDGGTTATVNHTLSAGSNRIVLALVMSVDTTDADRPASGVTYGGTAMYRIGILDSLSFNQTVEAWWLPEADLPSNAAHDCIATFSGSVTDSAIICAAYSGASQHAPKIISDTLENDSTPSLSVVTLVDDTLLVDFMGSNDTTITSEAADSGQVETVTGDLGSNTVFHSQKAVSTAGSASMGWTGLGTSNDHVYMVLSVEPPSSGSEPVVAGEVAKSEDIPSASSTKVIEHTLQPGSNRMIIALVGSFDTTDADRDVTGVQYDNGGTPINFTELSGAEVGEASVNHMEINVYYLLESSISGLTDGNQYDVEVTFNGTVTRPIIAVYQIDNAKQAAPSPVVSTNLLDDTNPSQSITTADDDSLVINWMSSQVNDVVTLTADSGQVYYQGIDIGGDIFVTSYKLVGSAGSNSSGYSGAGAFDDHSIVVFAIPPAAQELTFPLTSFTPVFQSFTVNQQLDFTTFAPTPVFHSFSALLQQTVTFPLTTFTPVFHAMEAIRAGTVTFPLTVFTPTFHELSLNQQLIFAASVHAPTFYGFDISVAKQLQFSIFTQTPVFHAFHMTAFVEADRDTTEGDFVRTR